MTLILHGTWVSHDILKRDNLGYGEGLFFIWAEMPFSGIPKRRGRKPTGTKLHPFNASPYEVWTCLSKYLSGGFSRKMDIVVPFLLPSRQDMPLPSSPILVQGDAYENGDEDIPLIPWRIEGIALDAKGAFHLLSNLETREMEDGISSPPFIIGDDIKFWTVVTKFGMELMAKEELVPSIWSLNPKDAVNFKAAWRPYLYGSNKVGRMKILSDSMPHIARAALPPSNTQNDRELSPPPDAGELISHYLNTAIDKLCRTWLSEEPGLNRGKKGLSKKSLVSQRVVQTWLKCLAHEEADMDIEWSELKPLYAGVHAWVAQLRTSDIRAAFRTCFFLEEPDISTDEWALRYFLQATDDPSLMIPAERVWEESGATLRFLNRRFENPQERLLADLGRASRIFEPIEKSLWQARPTHASLNLDEAYAFLREAAPILEESGYGILTPPWWKSRKGSLSLKLKIAPKRESNRIGSGLFSLESLMSYNWKLSIGDQELSEREFKRLASLKVPLIRIRGQWIELKPHEMQAAATFLKERNKPGSMTLGEALRYTATKKDAETLPIEGLEAEGEVANFIAKFQDSERIELLPQPKGLHGILRPYQLRGFSWLWFMRTRRIGVCLADDMGLGKTVQLIALLLAERENGLTTGPTLLICPTSVVGNWSRELERFAPSLKVMVHHGSERLSKDKFLNAVSSYDVVISTFALAYRDHQDLIRVNWSGIVLDEAQNIKNPHAKQSIAIRSLKGEYRIALTGTPVENRLTELWSIMEFLNPKFLGSLDGFRRNFAIPIEKYKEPKAAEDLSTLVRPFILRRLKTDPKIIDDLPEKHEMKVFCDLTKEQATLYQAVVTDMMDVIDYYKDIERKGLVLSALTKLKAICNHPAQFLKSGGPIHGRSGKLQRLIEMLEETMAVDDRVLIFTQFAQMGHMLRQSLQERFGTEVLFLHGGVQQKARDRMVDKFQNQSDGPPIFILSLRAGGTGLNLTRANHVFHFDRWWNPAVEDQATDRAFRIGQKRNVQVHKFICSGTLEERIDALIEAKRALAEEIIGTGEGWLTELSTDELRDLLTLREEIVE